MDAIEESVVHYSPEANINQIKLLPNVNIAVKHLHRGKTAAILLHMLALLGEK